MSDETPWEPEPPHDCRVTARCWTSSFGFSFEAPYDFARFRNESTAIETFFDRRQYDEFGGEGGDRIVKVKKRPVFSLHVGKSRGATWFDRRPEREPEAVVWLCAFEPHDERHKGRDDAYDRFASLEEDGELYPAEVDLKALELSRRIRDVAWSSEDAIEESSELLAQAVENGAAEGTVQGIGIRIRKVLDDPVFLGVAVSARPIKGRLSKADIGLTNERFLVVGASMRRAAAGLAADEPQLDIPTHEFPGGLHNERAFEIAFEPPTS